MSTEKYHAPTKVVIATGMALAFGAIGILSGFGNILGVIASATGEAAPPNLPFYLVLGTVTITLGILLVTCAIRLWRARPYSREILTTVVVFMGISAVSRLAMMTKVTFPSILGGILSITSVGIMLWMATSAEVRDYVARGVTAKFGQRSHPEDAIVDAMEAGSVNPEDSSR